MGLKQIIYINKIKFTCGFIENLCKKRGVSCYTLQDCCDFAYLIDDLKPDAVLIDGPTYDEEKEAFWTCVKAAELKTQYILLSKEECPELGEFTGQLSLPINAASFLDDLSSKIK